MTLNGFDLENAQRKLSLILRSVPDTTHIVVFTFSTAVVRDKNQVRQIVEHFDFDWTCDVIGEPEIDNVRFPSTSSPDLSNAV